MMSIDQSEQSPKQHNNHCSRSSLNYDDERKSFEDPSGDLCVSRAESFATLEQLCLENSEIFKSDQSEKGQRLYEAFKGWIDHIKVAQERVDIIQKFCHEYDFDEKTPGNGYRSFITAVDASINNGINICENVKKYRNSVFFRKGFYVKEVEASNHFLASLCTCLEYLLIMHEWSDDGNLFPSSHSVEELFQRGSTINQYCFYGRCLGIQYSDTIRGVLRFLSICMAGFSESYYSSAGRFAKTTSSMWTGGKYFWDPELRARRIVNISQNASIDFCKAFWFLAESEMMHMIPSIVGSTVKVNKVIFIPPEDLIFNSILTNKDVTIPIPTSHLGAGPVQVRLLLSNLRDGVIGEMHTQKQKIAPSKSLILHCHGGGFVAQSSKSHELYLRDWAVALNTPILSVDYSLAPKAPFPRALEEVFYAYCWALKNCLALGSTGEKIIVAGDSAGANLVIGCIFKCIELGIRKPDGLFIAYCPILVDFVPSPARMLCLMDPLLPFGFMMRCLKAYASPSDITKEENSNLVKTKEDILNARRNNSSYSLDNSIASSKQDDCDTKTVISPTTNSNWEHIHMDDGFPFSPTSDNTSDTFASASYHSQTVENTELITPEDASSCLSFEDDSQPITQMPLETGTLCPINTTKILENIDQIDSDSYVSTFIEKYVVEPSIEAKENGTLTLKPSPSKTPSEENLLIETGKDVLCENSIQNRINKVTEGFVDAISSTISKLTTSNEIKSSRSCRDEAKNLDALIARSPSDEFVFNVPKDPYLSPYWANDDVLAQFPPTRALTIDMDPCLDDCVMFSKRLRKLGIDVYLDILKGLPHGFLNFTMLSSEAMKGSNVCITRLKELLSD